MNNEPVKKDAELAASLNSDFPIKEGNYDIEIRPVHSGRFQWFKNGIRHYMIFETVLTFLLIVLVVNSFKLSSRYDRTYQMMSKVKAHLDLIEKQLSLGNYTEVSQEEAISDGFSMTTEPTQFTSIGKQESTEIISFFNASIEACPKSTEVFNAANYFIGARVNRRRSSSSDNSPFIGRDQSDYVLLDRKEPPPNKAWCSNEINPNLTVILAKTIVPTSVSYQHTKWNGTVPDGAPRIYDVVGCIDSFCENWEPLASDCEYNSSENETQEQICLIQVNETRRYGFKNVQFRFRENHGKVEKTCAYVVRVFGKNRVFLETKEEIEEHKETCTDLIWHYHNSPFVYNNLKYKNCSVLYNNNCCTECPECCEKCEVSDMNALLFSVVTIVFIFFLMCCWCLLLVVAASCCWLRDCITDKFFREK